MPLWLDTLRTPMAAPESARLQRMRRTWQLLCLSLCAALGRYENLRDMLGAIAFPFTSALLLATILYTMLYWACKERADRAFLDAAHQEEAP